MEIAWNWKKKKEKEEEKEIKRGRDPSFGYSRSQLLYRFDMLHLFTSCGQFAKSSPRALIAETKKNLNSVGIPSYSIPFWYRVFSLGSYKKGEKKTRMELFVAYRITKKKLPSRTVRQTLREICLSFEELAWNDRNLNHWNDRPYEILDEQGLLTSNKSAVPF